MKLEVRPPCIQVALTQQVFTRVEGETPWGHMAPSQGCWELGGLEGTFPGASVPWDACPPHPGRTLCCLNCTDLTTTAAREAVCLGPMGMGAWLFPGP